MLESWWIGLLLPIRLGECPVQGLLLHKAGMHPRQDRAVHCCEVLNIIWKEWSPQSPSEPLFFCSLLCAIDIHFSRAAQGKESRENSPTLFHSKYVYTELTSCQVTWEKEERKASVWRNRGWLYLEGKQPSDLQHLTASLWALSSKTPVRGIK